MVSSEGPDLKHISKMWKFEHNRLKMFILNTVDSSVEVHVAIVIVIILDFEDVTYFAKVAALVEFKQLI